MPPATGISGARACDSGQSSTHRSSRVPAARPGGGPIDCLPGARRIRPIRPALRPALRLLVGTTALPAARRAPAASTARERVGASWRERLPSPASPAPFASRCDGFLWGETGDFLRGMKTNPDFDKAKEKSRSVFRPSYQQRDDWRHRKEATEHDVNVTDDPCGHSSAAELAAISPVDPSSVTFISAMLIAHQSKWPYIDPLRMWSRRRSSAAT